MELLAGLVVLAGCGLKLHHMVAQGFPPFITGVVEVIGVMSLVMESFPSDNRFLHCMMGWKFRPWCGKGTWCVLLVHIATLLSIFQAKNIFQQDIGPVVLMAYCLAVLVVSVPIQLVGVIITDRTTHTTFLLFVTATAFGLSYILYTIGIFFGKLSEVELAAVLVLALWTMVVQCFIYVLFPKSFSRGEATIVSHGTFLLFIFNHILMYRTAAVSVLLVAFIMFIGPSLRKTVSFYGVLLGVAGAIATPILMLVLDKHFIVWIFEFISAKESRLALFLYWGICCCAAAAILCYTEISFRKKIDKLLEEREEEERIKVKENLLEESEESEEEAESNSKPDTESNHENQDIKNSPKYGKQTSTTSNDQRNRHKKQTAESTETKTNTRRKSNGSAKMPKHHKQPRADKERPYIETDLVHVARKYFHLFAICVFLPGMIVDREMLMVAATCAILVFILFEVMRKISVWPLGKTLDIYYYVFLDKRDQGPVVLTHLYLLVGCTLPLWLYPHPLEDGIHPALLSGLLSLGVGDTAASYFGTKFGVFRWPGTKKTVEGTMASIVFQIFALAILDHADVMIGLDWNMALTAICLTSLLEALTSQIDNLVLPLYMYILLIDPLRVHYR